MTLIENHPDGPIVLYPEGGSLPAGFDEFGLYTDPHASKPPVSKEGVAAENKIDVTTGADLSNEIAQRMLGQIMDTFAADFARVVELNRGRSRYLTKREFDDLGEHALWQRVTHLTSVCGGHNAIAAAIGLPISKGGASEHTDRPQGAPAAEREQYPF